MDLQKGLDMTKIWGTYFWCWDSRKLFSSVLLTIFTRYSDCPDSRPGLATILDFTAHVICDIVTLFLNWISLKLKCSLLNFNSSDHNPTLKLCVDWIPPPLDFPVGINSNYTYSTLSHWLSSSVWRVTSAEVFNVSSMTSKNWVEKSTLWFPRTACTTARSSGLPRMLSSLSLSVSSLFNSSISLSLFFSVYSSGLRPVTL